MTEIQRYLAEEIALDCSQGFITRSEALRRLRIMGVGAAVAAALLAACGAPTDDAPPAPPEPAAQLPDGVSAPGTADEGAEAASDADGEGSDDGAADDGAAATEATREMGAADPDVALETPPEDAADTPTTDEPAADDPAADEAAPDEPMDAVDEEPTPELSPAERADLSGPGQGLPTEEVVFDGPNGPLRGAFASPDEPRGAVLVIHENRGLNDHIRSVAGRFARAGYAALALDLLSEEGGTESLGDVANATAALGNAPPARFVADMLACVGELERRAPGARIGAVGFCFGGGMMWRLVATGDPRLSAVAPFYGVLPGGADFNGSNAAVLAFYGANDARVNATRDAAEAALTSAGLTHQLVTMPDANHAFFNDTGGNYNAAAATEAWRQVLVWFDDNLR